MKIIASGASSALPSAVGGWLFAKGFLFTGIAVIALTLAWSISQRAEHYRRVGEQIEGLVNTLITFHASLPKGNQNGNDESPGPSYESPHW